MRYPEIVIDPSVVYTNRKGERFSIIENLGKERLSNGKNVTMVRVKFIDTGYEKKAIYSQAINGGIIDPYSRDMFGVGCMGEIDEKFDSYIFARWKAMLSRCYYEKDHSYCYYGAKGVTVCPEWLVFANFLRDFKNLPGYNEFAAAPSTEKRLYVLDKDYLQHDMPPNKKVYSPSTCIIIHVDKNARLTNGNTTNVNLDFNRTYVGVSYVYGVYKASYVNNDEEVIIGYYSLDLAAANAYRYFCLDNNIPYNNDLADNELMERKEIKKFKAVPNIPRTYTENDLRIGRRIISIDDQSFHITEIIRNDDPRYLKNIVCLRGIGFNISALVSFTTISNGMLHSKKLIPAICGIGAPGLFNRSPVIDKIYNMWYRLLQYVTTNYPDNPTAHIYEPWLLFTNFLENVQLLEGFHKFFSKGITYHRLGIYKNVIGIPKENWVFGPDVCYIASDNEEDKCKFIYENSDPNTALGVSAYGNSFVMGVMNPYTKAKVKQSFDNFDAAANMYNHYCESFYGISPNALVPYMSFDECLQHRLEGYKNPVKRLYVLTSDSEDERRTRCLARYGMAFD